MLRLLFSFLCLIPSMTHAVIFKSSQVSREQYQRAAMTSNERTYTDWYLSQADTEAAEAHQQVQDFAHELLQNNGKTTPRQLADWQDLRAGIALNSADLEILTLLAEKLNLKNEFCRYSLLRVKAARTGASAETCLSYSEAVPKQISAKLHRKDLLMIDGVIFRADRVPSRLVAGSYQWRIISDEYRDQAFTGTAVQFARQNLPKLPWVEGNESHYQLKHDDLNIQSSSKIAFAGSAIAPGIPVPRTLSSWAADHKTALWTAGILLGGFAAYGLRNKDIIVSN